MKYRNDIIAVTILILVIVLRFAPFIFQGKPINTDSWKSYYPWRAEYQSAELKTVNYDSNMEYGVFFPFAKQELSEGRFPLWNPYSGSGMPFYDDHLVPVFHVPFAIALFFDGDEIYAVYILAMCLIGTLLFYWFLRNWKFSVYVSMFGGLVFFLSGWQMYLYPPEVASLIWIPGILLFYDRFLASNRLSDACLSAFCIAQLLIGGYPVMIAHFFYIIAIYMLWRRFSPSFKWKASYARWVSAILIMAFCGLLISAVQNYPTYKFTKLTNRDINTESESFQTPEELIEKRTERVGTGVAGAAINHLIKKSQLIIPNFKMDMNTSRNFAGVVVVFLALLGLFAAERKFWMMKLLFVIFGIFYMVAIVFVMVARYIPLWSISALAPTEVFFFLLFFMSVLGLDYLERLNRRSSLVISLAVFIGIAGVVLGLAHPLMNPASGADSVGSTVQDLTIIWIYILTSLILLVPVIAAGLNHPISRTVSCLAVFLFIMQGLLAHYYLYPYFDSKQYMPSNSLTTFLQNASKNGRIVNSSSEFPRLAFEERLDYILPPNTPTRFGIMDSLCYDNMLLATMEEYYSKTIPDSFLRQRGIFHVKPESLDPNSFFVRSSGIRYVVMLEDEQSPAKFGTPVFSDYGLDVYDLKNYEEWENPFLREIKKFELEENYNAETTLDDIKDLVLLDKPPVLPDGRVMETMDDAGDNALELTCTLKNPQFVRYEMNTPSDCLLYFAETYHPNWRAKINGEEVEIIRANYSFRALAVPAGSHEIEIWYNRTDFNFGALISAIGLILLVLIGIVDSSNQMRNVRKKID